MNNSSEIIAFPMARTQAYRKLCARILKRPAESRADYVDGVVSRRFNEVLRWGSSIEDAHREVDWLCSQIVHDFGLEHMPDYFACYADALPLWRGDAS